MNPIEMKMLWNIKREDPEVEEWIRSMAADTEQVEESIEATMAGNVEVLGAEESTCQKLCAQAVTKSIKEEMDGCLFSDLIDESSDISVKEQMAMVVRYVNKIGDIIERFLGIQNIPNTTSPALKKTLLEVFSKHGLLIARLRGQGYIQNLDNIGRLTPEEIVKGKRATSQPVEAKLQQQPSTAVAWSRPPNGTVKLNIDGAYIAQTGSAGAGMILRRDDGYIIFSACRSLKFCSSALESELQACLEGVRLALDGCTNDIIVETDNLELSLMAKSAARDASTLSHLMEDLRLLIKSKHSIITEFDHRFNEAFSEVIQNFSGLDPRDSFARFNRVEDFRVFLDIASLAKKMVELERHIMFPTVYRLVELAMLLPVGTTTVERLFSAMKIIKTELRNKMSDGWLNDLMVCYIERGIFKSLDLGEI
ncbi:uncharacterized protein [Lolium perenne]|uniref:uncharacterized protein n=1 Tax=Lolium perenne TaxID=4522 RepID=UPI003A9A0774